MQFFINGNAVSESQARNAVNARAMAMGCAPEDINHAWLNADRSEEARDMLAELSDYTLEIITND